MATDAGSRMHVLDWIELPNGRFIHSLNELLKPSGAQVGLTDQWRPLGRKDPSELRLTDRQNAILSAETADLLRKWWLMLPRRANAPNWDFASTATFDGGRSGVVLIEAKAHVAELKGEAKGKPPGNPANHAQIGLAIDQAALELSSLVPGVHISRDTHYQFSNRIAFSWKLASLGVPVVLIYLGFTGDMGITDQGEPLKDNRHWRTVFFEETQDIFPPAYWEREILIDQTPLWMLVRSLDCIRPSPSPSQRPRLENSP
jgi:hypothetical protein